MAMIVFEVVLFLAMCSTFIASAVNFFQTNMSSGIGFLVLAIGLHKAVKFFEEFV